MKKSYLLLAAWVLLMLPCHAQNVAINTDGSLPNPNAILDIKSGNKGLLIPRMSSAARSIIANTKGLLVYDTTTNSFWYNTGAQWQNMASASSLALADSAWLLTGNSGTVDGTNFIGTKDNVPLNIRVNNQPSGRIDATNENSFWGYTAGAVNTGASNTGIGFRALLKNTTGFENTSVGAASLQNNTLGTNNSAFGYESLFSNIGGSGNTSSGFRSLYVNTTGYNNSAFGSETMISNSTGALNTVSGNRCMYSNTTGSLNVASGADALYSNTEGAANTAIGFRTMYFNTTGIYNTAAGIQALEFNSTGNDNTAIGHNALVQNTTGSTNSAVGLNALVFNETGSNNTAVGVNAAFFNETGSDNTAVGHGTLLSNNFGNYNTGIGDSADVSSGNLSNATAIGAGAVVDASNKVRIGNSAVTVIEGQVPFTTPSDGRFKFHVQEDVKGLDFILHLRPVTYQFDVKRFDAQWSHPTGKEAKENYAMQAGYDEATRIRRTGFIAQEVEQAAIKASYDFSGIIKPKTEQDHYSLSYDAFVVPLVKAVQEQQQIIETQNRKMEKQEQKIAAQQQVNDAQNKKLAELQQQLDEIKKLLQHPQ